MKLGMPILFEYDNLEDNFKLARKLGLDFVELNLNFPYCRKEMENGNVQELLAKYQLEATLHFYDEADFGLYDEVVNAYLLLLEKYIKYSKEYVKIVNFHNNEGPIVTISGKKNFIFELEYNDYINRVIQNFKKAQEILTKANVKMVIENIDGHKAEFLNKNYKYLATNNFHFNLDIGHDHLCGESFYNQAIVNNYVFDEFHFHDGTDQKCHLALGEGNINLKKYKDLAMKYDPYILLEVKSSEDLIKSTKYFKDIA